MVNKSIAVRKITIARECLAKLKKYKSLKREEFLRYSEAQDVVLHNLVLSIQASIDLGAHVLSDEGWGVPGTQAEVFRILQEHGVISTALSKELIRAVGLRNFLIHEYDKIDFSIIHDVLTRKIRFFDEYIESVVEFFKI